MPFALLERVATPIARECGVATPIVLSLSLSLSLSLTMKVAISRCSLFSFFLVAAEVVTPIASECEQAIRIAREGGHSNC